MSKWVVAGGGAGARSGQILKLEDRSDVFLVRVTLGRDGRGRRRTRSKTVHGTYADAEAVLNELSLAKYQRRLTTRSEARLSDLVYDWLKHKAGKVSDRTLAGYENMLEAYVLPTLGHRRLDSITLRDVDALYTSMQAGMLPRSEPDGQGRRSGWQGGPLSAATIRQTNAALSQALRQAVKWGMIPFDPAAEATLPPITRKEKRALTLVERDAFLGACETSDAFYALYYRLLVVTGLRPGEACGLRWDDLDFANGLISVQRAVTRGRGGQRVEAPPKTPKSRRSVPMYGIEDALLEHRNWQVRRGLDASGYVFTNHEGRMLAPWAMDKKELVRICRSAGITWAVTPYTFRHTFATMQLEMNIPDKIVSRYMGHSTTRQLSATYQHVSTEMELEYADRFMERISEATTRAKGGRRLPN